MNDPFPQTTPEQSYHLWCVYALLHLILASRSLFIRAREENESLKVGAGKIIGLVFIF